MFNLFFSLNDEDVGTVAAIEGLFVKSGLIVLGKLDDEVARGVVVVDRNMLCFVMG